MTQIERLARDYGMEPAVLKDAIAIAIFDLDCEPHAGMALMMVTVATETHTWDDAEALAQAYKHA